MCGQVSHDNNKPRSNTVMKYVLREEMTRTVCGVNINQSYYVNMKFHQYAENILLSQPLRQGADIIHHVSSLRRAIFLSSLSQTDEGQLCKSAGKMEQ